jgi:predicted lipoprotein with Yx(FWY)xxD motif
MATLPRRLLALPAILLVAGACTGGTGATTAPTSVATQAPPTTAPATQAPPTEAPATEPPATAEPTMSAEVTVVATEVGNAGTILVDGATGLTLYIFTEDVRDSGESACTGGCLAAWPALTVEAGETPTGGPGVTGELGTITRADNGELQVTYDGLPLYFFASDTAPGDLNGVYPQWETVAP